MRQNALAHGSSPRVWGTYVINQSRSCRRRFIPTCVGNISKYHRRRYRRTVHPHVCGEHSASRCAPFLFNGSSPRVWGTCHACRQSHDIVRFIPTCVGNIQTGSWGTQPTAVHPHVCGEHFCAIKTSCFDFGSSPRVWGTFWNDARHDKLFRFIPTCVGNIW